MRARHHSLRAARFFAAMSVAVVQGCASRQPAAIQQSVIPRERAELRAEPAARRISAEQLREVRGQTALDAVRQLRPEFLRTMSHRIEQSEPSSVSVYENGRYLGGADALGNLPLLNVIEIVRLTEVHARNLFGSRCPCGGGVIAVRTSP